MKGGDILLFRVPLDSETAPDSCNGDSATHYIWHSLTHEPVLTTVLETKLGRNFPNAWFRIRSVESQPGFSLEHFITEWVVVLEDGKLMLSEHAEDPARFEIVDEELILTHPCQASIHAIFNPVKSMWEIGLGKTAPSCATIKFESDFDQRDVGSVGGVYYLRCKEVNFYLGIQDAECQYADVQDDSALWMLFSLDLVSGGSLRFGRKYLLQNVLTNQFLNNELSLTPDVSQAMALTITGGMEDAQVTLSSSFSLQTAREERFRFTVNMLESAAMKRMYPIDYSAEIITHFAISIKDPDKEGKFELILPDFPARAELQLRILSHLLKEDLQDVETEVKNLSEPAEEEKVNSEFLKDILLDLQYHAQLVCTLHQRTDLMTEQLFSNFTIPAVLNDCFLRILELSKSNEFQSADLLPLARHMVNLTFPVLGKALIELMFYSRKSCLQVNTRSAAIIQYFYSESQFIPKVFELTQSVLSPSTDLDGMVNSFNLWLAIMQPLTEDNAYAQALVLILLISIMNTVHLAPREWARYEQVIRTSNKPILTYQFLSEDNVVYLNFCGEGDFQDAERRSVTRTENFIAIEDVTLAKGWPSDAIDFVARIIELVTAFDRVSNNQAQGQLFPLLHLTDEILRTIVVGEADLKVKTAAVKALSYRTSTNDKCERAVISAYSSPLLPGQETLSDDPSFSMVAVQLHHHLSALPTESNADFLVELLKFAQVLIKGYPTSHSFSEAVSEELRYFLVEHRLELYEEWKMEETTAKNAPSNGRLKSSFIQSKLISAIMDTFEALLLTSELGQARVLFLKLQSEESESALYEDFSRLWTPPHGGLQPIVFNCLLYAAGQKIPIKSQWRDILNRTLTPYHSVLAHLPALVDYKSSLNLEEVLQQLTPKPFERDMILDIASSDDLRTVVTAIRETIGMTVSLLRDERTENHIQTVLRETHLYQFYIDYWVNIYTRIYKSQSSSPELLQSLYQLGSSMFQFFFHFVRHNPTNKELVREQFNPYLYYLTMTEEADLVRELCDFQHYPLALFEVFITHILRIYPAEDLKVGAYRWIEVAIINSDGSTKLEFQETAFAVLQEKWNIASFKNESVVVLRLLALCSVGTEGLKTRCATVVTVSSIANMVKKIKTPKAVETALFAVALIHGQRPGDNLDSENAGFLLQILQTTLAILDSLLVPETIRTAIESGLYEQATHQKKVNFCSEYGSERRPIEAMRLVSSGTFPTPLGGIANLLPVLVETYGQDRSFGKAIKDALFPLIESLHRIHRVVADLQMELTGICDCGEVLRCTENCFAWGNSNARDQREPDLVRQVKVLKHFGRKTEYSLQAIGALLMQVANKSDLPRLLELIHSEKRSKRHLSVWLKQLIASNLYDRTNVSGLFHVLFTALLTSHDPRGSYIPLELLNALLTSGKVPTEAVQLRQFCDWLGTALSIQGQLLSEVQTSAIRNMNLIKLTPCGKAKHLTELFPGVVRQGLACFRTLLKDPGNGEFLKDEFNEKYAAEFESLLQKCHGIQFAEIRTEAELLQTDLASVHHSP